MEPLPTLVLLEDDRKGERIPIPMSGTRLGRASDNDVVIQDASVSRHHAEFHRVADGRMLVEDKGSSGGTFVNDRRIDQAEMFELKSGDLITFGSYRAQLILLDEYDLENDDESRTVFLDPAAAAKQQELLAAMMTQASEDAPSVPSRDVDDDTDELRHRTMAGLPPVSSVAASAPRAAPRPAGSPPTPSRPKPDADPEQEEFGPGPVTPAHGNGNRLLLAAIICMGIIIVLLVLLLLRE